MQPPEIDFRFTPNNGHSEAHAGLPVLTQPGHEFCSSNHQNLAIRPLRGENSSNGRWEMGKVGVDLKIIWEISSQRGSIMPKDTPLSAEKEVDLFELYAEDPELADELVFGRVSHKDRRGFLKGAGLAINGQGLRCVEIWGFEPHST